MKKVLSVMLVVLLACTFVFANGDRVSYEKYRRFEEEFSKKVSVHRSISSMEPDALSDIYDKCKVAGVTVNDYLIAMMMIEDNTDTVLISLISIGVIAIYSYAVFVSKKKKQ